MFRRSTNGILMICSGRAALSLIRSTQSSVAGGPGCPLNAKLSAGASV